MPTKKKSKKVQSSKRKVQSGKMQNSERRMQNGEAQIASIEEQISALEEQIAALQTQCSEFRLQTSGKVQNGKMQNGKTQTAELNAEWKIQNEESRNQSAEYGAEHSAFCILRSALCILHFSCRSCRDWGYALKYQRNQRVIYLTQSMTMKTIAGIHQRFFREIEYGTGCSIGCDNVTDQK